MEALKKGWCTHKSRCVSSLFFLLANVAARIAELQNESKVLFGSSDESETPSETIGESKVSSVKGTLQFLHTVEKLKVKGGKGRMQ